MYHPHLGWSYLLVLNLFVLLHKKLHFNLCVGHRIHTSSSRAAANTKLKLIKYWRIRIVCLFVFFLCHFISRFIFLCSIIFIISNVLLFFPIEIRWKFHLKNWQTNRETYNIDEEGADCYECLCICNMNAEECKHDPNKIHRYSLCIFVWLNRV